MEGILMAAARQRGMTYDDYCALPDDGNRYEVLEGELVVAPSPDFEHQDVIWELGARLRLYVRTHRLGRVVGAPMDVVLAPDTVVQPDILFISQENADIVRDRVWGSPDLCIEVLSPSTGKRDRGQKKELYTRFGVREYWIVDTNRQTVAVCTLQDRIYGEPIERASDDLLRSTVIEGFIIRARDIFAT
jgi:Uma2 family endonuclease